jgi:DNA-binding MarR family transcriptional regulator
LKFKKNKDYFVIVEKHSKPADTNVPEYWVYFAIKMNGERLDEIADELGLKANLDGTQIQCRFYKE